MKTHATALCVLSLLPILPGGELWAQSELPGLRVTPSRTPEPAPAAPRPSAAGGQWTIVLATYRGEAAAALAEDALNKARQAGLGDAFIEQRGPAVVLAVGRYADPSSAEALQRLAHVREVRIGGGRAYLGAFLAPPGDTMNVGSRPEYNLLAARDQFGARARYSLQIAVYGREELKRDPTEAELKESRKAAEDAAAKLRQEGELAFYFHGPRRSMVCIGVFSDEDLASKSTPEAPPRSENPDLSALRQRFPHNLYNGAGVREKNAMGQSKMQPSLLVAIPER